MKTAQRVSAVDPSDGFVFARSVLAYRRAAELVRGDVLEIGTGTGYGVALLAPVCRTLTTVDKTVHCSLRASPSRLGHSSELDGPRLVVGSLLTVNSSENVSFRRMSVPPLDFPDASFDCVVSFQVIEHVRRDRELIKEIARVLRPGGRLVLSTPNRAMSLTRNPWHVREYSPDELRELLEDGFGEGADKGEGGLREGAGAGAGGAVAGTGLRVTEALGVFGGGRAMEYFERNRLGVERWTRWDVLRLRDWLPRWLLRAPYDVANRLNRRALAGEIFTPDDYFFAPAADQAFDLFYVATKN